MRTHRRRRILCALTALLLLSELFPQVQATELFANGGCFSYSVWSEQANALRFSGVATLHGSSLFMRVREEPYAFAVNTFDKEDMTYMIVTVSDLPEARSPKQGCVLFYSTEPRGRMGLLDVGQPAVKSWIVEPDLQSLRNICAEKVMPVLM